MTQLNRSILIAYSAEQMFDVVNNVSAYPTFLPWCDEARVISADHRSMIAELTVARSGIKQSFTTQNELFRPDRIELKLVEGPFRMLSGSWQFLTLRGGGCRVEMQLRFDIDSRFMSGVISKVFEQEANSMVDAFCDQADHIYGDPND